MISTGATTRRRLASDLRAIGLAPGRDVLVHCAMSRLGPVPGGPETLFLAIREVIGASACVVVPTQTANNSTTSRDYRASTAGMSAAQRRRHEDGLPGFDPASTPSHRMGALAEYVRRRPGAIRSGHPQTSFAAVGPTAARLMGGHELTSHLGERSPLAALYRAGAVTLLLGVGFDKCTALHLAEYRLRPPVPTRTYTCFLRRAGERVRCSFEAPDLDDRDFARLGETLRRQPWVSFGYVGGAATYLVPVRRAVDHAVAWLTAHRTPLAGGRSTDRLLCVPAH